VVEQTTGKGAGEQLGTATYVSVEGGKIIYTTFVAPVVERAVNTVAESSIAQAEAQAAAGSSIVSGINSLITGATEVPLRFYAWLLSLFSWFSCYFSSQRLRYEGFCCCLSSPYAFEPAYNVKVKPENTGSVLQVAAGPLRRHCGVARDKGI